MQEYYNMTEPLVVNQRRKTDSTEGELVVIRQEMVEGWRVLCSEAEYHLLIVFRDDAKVEKYSFLGIFPK